MLNIRILYIATLLILTLSSCSDELNVIPDNEPGSDFNISDLKIESYVNRLFIDLIGREPTDVELNIEVDTLKASNLNREARLVLISKLMTDTTPQINEGSYREAYYQNLYNLAKVRCLESVPDPEIRKDRNITYGGAIRDSLNGKWEQYYRKLNTVRRYDNLLASFEAFRNNDLNYREVMSVMMDNPVYDKINMNTFNFVRATFDQMLWRLPTQQEYDVSFNMIEFGEFGQLFNRYGSHKDDYLDILINSWGMYEGMVIWAFQLYMSREPSPQELYTIAQIYLETQDISNVISEILLTDEYASFE